AAAPNVVNGLGAGDGVPLVGDDVDQRPPDGVVAGPQLFEGRPGPRIDVGVGAEDQAAVQVRSVGLHLTQDRVEAPPGGDVLRRVVGGGALLDLDVGLVPD